MCSQCRISLCPRPAVPFPENGLHFRYLVGPENLSGRELPLSVFRRRGLSPGFSWLEDSGAGENLIYSLFGNPKLTGYF